MMLRVLSESGFVTFLTLLFCAFCGLECIVLHSEEGSGRRWLIFLSFYLWQSLALAWELLAPLFEAGPVGALLVPFLQSLGFGSLFALVSVPAPTRRFKRLMLFLSIGLIAACAVAAPALGAQWYGIFVDVLLGVPAVAFAVRFILSDPAIRIMGRPWLVLYAAAFGAFGLCLLAESVQPPAFLSILEAFLSVALTVSLTVHEWRSFNRANKGLGGWLTRATIYGAFFIIPVVIVLGGVFTSDSEARTTARLRSSYSSDVEQLKSGLQLQMQSADRDVFLLSRSKRIVDFLTLPDTARRLAAEAMLDLYSDSTPGAIFYLLDPQGRAVISSNRSAPSSFVGLLLPEIPATISLLTESANAGRQWRFFAPGKITGYRGYYAAATVYDARGSRIGVAVAKRNLSSMLRQFAYVPDSFLVNALGVVYLTGTPAYFSRTLWPISRTLQGLLESNTETSGISFSPLTDGEPSDGSVAHWRGQLMLVTRTFLDIPGWSLVKFGPLRDAFLSRMAGMLATLIASLLIAGYTVTAQLTLLGQSRMERSESLYRTLIEGSPNWVSVVNSAGSFVFTNKAGQDAVGLDSSTQTRAQVEQLLGARPAAEVSARVQEASHKGVVSFETTMKVASGQVRTWRLTVVPLREEGTAASAILIGNDITDFRNAEARLLRAERLAAVGTLAAGVAHQFNNINAVAMGYLQVLEIEKALPATASRYAGFVRVALERSVELTSRLMPLSVAPGVEEPAISLVEVVRGSLQAIHRELEKEAAMVDFSPAGPAMASVNPEQLRFIVDSLLGNAWHAVLDQPNREIHISTGTADGMSFLLVQDSGIGIPREKMNCLFTPFFSEKGEHAPSGSPQARVHGVGLSLAVSHAIVTGHNGRIEVQSEQGKGSTFTVWLPAAPASPGADFS